MRPRDLNLKIPVLLICLSLVPFIAGMVRLVGLMSGAEATAENARFFSAPLPVTFHILSALLFCILGAFQFPQGFRLRWPNWHRKSGWLLIPAGMIAAISGVWMTLFYSIPTPLQGSLLYITRVLVGSAMFMSIALAVISVLKRNITHHKAWMLRAYALGQGAGTQVLIFLPATLLYGEITGGLRDVLMVSAWVINILFVETIIRRKLL